MKKKINRKELIIKNEGSQIFNELAEKLIIYLFSFWCQFFALCFSFLSIIFLIDSVCDGFNLNTFLFVFVRTFVTVFIIAFIYLYNKKFGKNLKNLNESHDLIVVCFCFVISILKIYENINYIDSTERMQILVREEIFFISYFIPWLTIFNKTTKIVLIVVSQFLIIIARIIFTQFENIDIAKGLLYLFVNFLINVKISELIQIYIEQIKKNFTKKENTTIFWKKVIDDVPVGYIIIKASKNKIMYMNEHAKKLLKIESFNKNSYTDVNIISEKLGSLVKISNENDMKSKTNNLSESKNSYRDQPKFINNHLKTVFHSQSSEKFTLLNILQNYSQNVKINSLLFETLDDIKKIIIKINFGLEYKGSRCCSIFIDNFSLLKEREKCSKNNIEFQSRLLKSFSHELKTPLNGSIPSLEIALCALNSEEKFIHENISHSLKSLKILQFVLSSIIDLSSIISHQFYLHIEKLNIKECVQEILSLLEPQIVNKELNVHFKMDSNVEEFINTDRLRLSIVLYNLISNAIKFTFHGEINISISKLADQNWYKFYIMDTGIGINPETVNKMNNYFSNNQIPGNEFSFFNDSNICFGLNICNILCSQINEEGNSFRNGLFVESSREDQGSVFSFIISNKENVSIVPLVNEYEQSLFMQQTKNRSLPLTKLYNRDPSSEIMIDSSRTDDLTSKLDSMKSWEPDKNPFNFVFDNSKSIPILSKLHSNSLKCQCRSILIIDDDPFNQLTLEFILKHFNINSERANNGLEAISRLSMKNEDTCVYQCQPKLIFMDYEMPIMNGVETTIRLKQMMFENLIPYIPIIGCTAYGTKVEIEQFFCAGIDDLIQKPITVQKVKDRLIKWKILTNNDNG